MTNKLTSISSTPVQKKSIVLNGPWRVRLVGYPTISESSWKCVAKSVRHRLVETRWWRVANAIARPSLTVVPRPTSSMITWNMISIETAVWKNLPYETLWGRTSQDLRSLEHLDHEGTPVMEQVILSSYSWEQFVYNTNCSKVSGHEWAHLGQNNDQSRLTKERGLPRHVRARDDM
jgi:hypothetical protein